MEKHLKIIVVFFVFILLAINSVFTVGQSQQALLMQFGELVKVEREPGLHFKIPFIQSPFYLDKRVLNVIAEEKELIAKDQKRVIISAFAKYRIVDPLKFYQTVRSTSGLQSRLNNIFDSSLRLVIGREPLMSLLTDKRSEMMQSIQELVNDQSKNFGIDVVDVRILRADLPDKNSEAVYQRMKSDRYKEAREIRAKGEKEAQIIKSRSNKEKTMILASANKKSQIIRGEGDAKATNIYADAFSKDPEFYNYYRTLESYKKSFSSSDTDLYLSTKDKYLKFFSKN